MIARGIDVGLCACLFTIAFPIVIALGIKWLASPNKNTIQKTGQSKRRRKPYRPAKAYQTSSPKYPKSDVDRVFRLIPELEKLDPEWRPSYSITHIPKRSGGTRELQVPCQTTKQIQVALYRKLFARYETHPSACGFISGKSIVDNAKPHVGNDVIVKLDIKEFFPSTSRLRILNYFRTTGWTNKASILLTQLLCYEQGLPQGAPTSPVISNIVNKSMDRRLDSLANEFNASYTRYADDITFSMAVYHRDRVHALLQSTGVILRTYGYKLNNRKKRIIRGHRRQEVTGLVVNDVVNLPRSRRRWLRSVQHRLSTGMHTSITPSQYQGWISLLQMVSPDSPIIARHKELLAAGMLKSNGKSGIKEAGGHEEKVLDETTERISAANSNPPQTDIADGLSESESTSIVSSDGGSESESLRETPLKEVTQELERESQHAVGGSADELFHETRLTDKIYALKEVRPYSDQAKQLQEEFKGSQHTTSVILESLKRSFSFKLPEGYQKGRTLSGLLPDGTEIELYTTDISAELLDQVDLPIQGDAVIEVIQWNNTFKRVEAILLDGLM